MNGKLLSLALCAIAWAGVSASGQVCHGRPTDSATQTHGAQVSHPAGRQVSCELRAAAMCENLERACGGLTAEQRTQAKQAYTKMCADIAAVQQNRSCTAVQKNVSLQACYDECQRRLCSILTQEQRSRCGLTPAASCR